MHDDTLLLPAHALALRSFAFDRISATAAVLDAEGVVVDTNQAWRLFTQLNDGSPQRTGVGVNYLDVCDRAADPETQGTLEAAVVARGLRQILDGEREHFDFEYPCSSPDQDRWFMLQASATPVSGGAGLVLFHVDMTAHKLLADCLTAEADHDALTGLRNRRAAVRFIEEQLGDARGTGMPFHVLFLDLDGFKSANDTYGHHVGDELLVQVATRARRAVRASDQVYRLGGDEFLFVCPGSELAYAGGLAQRLREVMARPFQVGADQVSIGASVGLASSTADSTVDSILGAADARMYADKRGRTRVVPAERS